MKRSLLIVSTFLSAMTFAQDCTELFISEYVEGERTNRALEIYNPTANTIDLSQYIVIRFSNGGSSAETNYSVQLVGTIAPYSTHVGVVDLRVVGGTGVNEPVDQDLQDKADQFYCPDYNANSTWFWNGNDAVVLAKGLASNPGAAAVKDIFGKIGEDPGISWTTTAPYTQAAGGTFVTKDHSLIRKPGIMKGVTNPIISSFNALAEYDSIPAEISAGIGNWASLGSHDCNCAPASLNEVSSETVSIFPNPSNGTFTVKGIEGITSIQVVNALGQIIEQIDTKTNSMIKIDLSNKKGVYFVKLMGETGELITKKVIIK
jgi:hypothetical protein